MVKTLSSLYACTTHTSKSSIPLPRPLQLAASAGCCADEAGRSNCSKGGSRPRSKSAGGGEAGPASSRCCSPAGGACWPSAGPCPCSITPRPGFVDAARACYRGLEGAAAAGCKCAARHSVCTEVSCVKGTPGAMQGHTRKRGGSGSCRTAAQKVRRGREKRAVHDHLVHLDYSHLNRSPMRFPYFLALPIIPGTLNTMHHSPHFESEKGLPGRGCGGLRRPCMEVGKALGNACLTAATWPE